MFDEEGDDVLYADAVLDSLFGLIYGLKDAFSRDDISSLVLAQEVVAIEVVERIDETFVFGIVEVRDRLLEGILREVHRSATIHVVGSNLVRVLVLLPLGFEVKIFYIVHLVDIHEGYCEEV